MSVDPSYFWFQITADLLGVDGVIRDLGKRCPKSMDTTLGHLGSPEIQEV